MNEKEIKKTISEILDTNDDIIEKMALISLQQKEIQKKMQDLLFKGLDDNPIAQWVKGV